MNTAQVPAAAGRPSAMSSVASPPTSAYAKCIAASRRVRWEIERDVIRDRTFRLDRRFLPDSLTLAHTLGFLSPDERRLWSQVQGRTYARMFGLVERFIAAKVLQVAQDHALSDATALEALVRFADEELKHQALFDRLDMLMDDVLPAGHDFPHDANAVAVGVLRASTWSVLALTCHIELFTQVHYRHSVVPDDGLCELFRDVLRFHWQEESQHAILDELEWRRENARLDDAQRDAAVDDLIGLVGAVDGLLRTQAACDAHYFQRICGRAFTGDAWQRLQDTMLAAYRWQYLLSGLQEPRFRKVLRELTSPSQLHRLQQAAAPLFTAVAAVAQTSL